METKLYFLETTPYVRRVQAYLDANGIPYTEQYLPAKPLSKEQLIELLQFTVIGVDEILATQSNIYKELKAKGVDIEGYTISGLWELFKEYPKLLRSPILVGKNTTIVGYNEEEMSVLKTRKRKKESYGLLLHEFQVRHLVS
ncbi:hypothetical protein ACA30_13445 [Virgibacillus soli]|nr:hypothetical protein ACA30_13445 [Virgibacillus soli]